MNQTNNNDYTQLGFIWDPTSLELLEDLVWDSKKKNANYTSSDGQLNIVDGVWTIKKGFKWNGCTAVPDGDAIPSSEKIPVKSNLGYVPITYIASCIHDIGYLNLSNGNFPYTKEDIDNYFQDELKKAKFKYAETYYWGVVVFGGWARRLAKLYDKIVDMIGFNPAKKLPKGR